MYWQAGADRYFVGYFKVERVKTASGSIITPTEYQTQWDMIFRPSAP
jgi:hypothetical protein